MPTLEHKLARRSFVVTAEMPVIDGGGRGDVLRHLEPMAPYVDAFNATDNPSAHAHCSPLAVSIALSQAGAEPIMQLACRDRNRLALEAELMGAAMHGVVNVSCMTGDDVSAGDEPESRRVFDVDSSQLIAIARTLDGGHYLSGRAIDPRPHFLDRRGREPRNATIRVPRPPRRQEGARRSELPAAAALLQNRAARRVHAGGRRHRRQ